MRTTLTLDEQIAKALKSAAHRSGKTFKQVVNETLRAGLTAGDRPVKARTYRIRPVSLGGAMPGIDLNKALSLADALDDLEIARKLAQRK